MTEYKLNEIEKNTLILLSLKDLTYNELEETLGIQKPEEQLKMLVQFKLIELKKTIFKKTINITDQGKNYLGNNIITIFITKDRILLKNHDSVQAEVKVKNLGKKIVQGQLIITSDKYLKIYNPQIKNEKNVTKIQVQPMFPGESFSLKLVFASATPENIDRLKALFTITFTDDKGTKLATQEDFFYIEGRII